MTTDDDLFIYLFMMNNDGLLVVVEHSKNIVSSSYRVCTVAGVNVRPTHVYASCNRRVNKTHEYARSNTTISFITRVSFLRSELRRRVLGPHRPADEVDERRRRHTPKICPGGRRRVSDCFRRTRIRSCHTTRALKSHDRGALTRTVRSTNIFMYRYRHDRSRTRRVHNTHAHGIY